jgi:hypothetical protein
MFIDEIKIFAQAGHGGKGCVAFHREAYITKGGPIKTLGLYFSGNAAKQDNAFMRRMIDSGMVPITKVNGEVVFVDATYGIATLALKPLHHNPQAPDPGPQTWSHQLTPQALLMLAGELYGHQPAALQLLVPAQWDGHGEGFSPEAAAVLPRAMALLVGWAGGGCRRA